MRLSPASSTAAPGSGTCPRKQSLRSSPQTPRRPQLLLSVVIGFPGLQDPLDQATLLEQLGTGGSGQHADTPAPSPLWAPDIRAQP